MAIEYSDEYVTRQYKQPQLLLLRTVIRLFPVIDWVRRSQRRLSNPSAAPVEGLPDCNITDALEASADHFRVHRWAFVDGILEPTFHECMVRNWPRRRYFTAPFDRCKSYDKGFPWVRMNPADNRWRDLLSKDARNTTNKDYPPFIQEHAHLKVFIDYLRSDSFTKRIGAYLGASEPLAFNRFQLTATYPGSFVAPHRDSPQPGKNWISLLFYIAGSGGDRSGGTAILRDNRFEDVIFEPKQLTNSCLIFDPFAPFFHGVRPIAFGKYRWMAGVEYVSNPDTQARDRDN